MTPMRYIVQLGGPSVPERDLVGGKAWSVARMRALGLRVPAAFVATTDAYRAFEAEGELPKDLIDEIAEGIAGLERESDRRFTGGPRRLLVSVRSGAAVSMPGMMDTVLNLGMNDEAERSLAAESRDSGFARDTHSRFLTLYTEIVLKGLAPRLRPDDDPAQWRADIEAAAGTPVPTDPMEQLYEAVRAVFRSWNSPRARRYRKHQQISDDLGTAVTVQAMVFGNLDDRSGTGVLFSRNPLDGTNEVFGEYLACAQGEDVVSGKVTPQPLSVLAGSMPELHGDLIAAAATLEAANAEVQDIEFTVQRGTLYLLQSRSAKLSARAAVQTSLDLVREGVVDVAAALRRISPDQVRTLLAPRLRTPHTTAPPLAQGESACPGVGIGVVAVTADEAERVAASGRSVVLARPTTSPHDIHGMVVAAGIVTEEGGSTSHAAVVSRALGVPCVVGCGVGSLSGLAGRLITVDGQSGQVYDGAMAVDTPDETTVAELQQLTAWAAAAAPIQVLTSDDVGDREVLDLHGLDGGADPDRIGALLASAQATAGVRGGAIATDAGVRAAVAEGFEFIVAQPVLPVLLTAVHLSAEPATTREHR